jgi:ribosomal protein S18 acetylase RimI-like enzyme
MEFTIRPAKREDCAAILDLVRQLAAFEKAPQEVTITLAHFEEAGFGEKPVWWAFVACAPPKEMRQSMEADLQSMQEIQDPLLRKVLNVEAESGLPETLTETTDSLDVKPVAKLEEAVNTILPDPVQEALPLHPDSIRCVEVVGFALYYRRFSTWKGERMYLEDIFVREDHRGTGIGTALMDTLIASARAQDLHGISWQVLKWNESAIRFYTHFGMRLDDQWLNAGIDIPYETSNPQLPDWKLRS